MNSPSHSRVRAGLGWAVSGLSALCPPLNFITIHYAYFIVVLLVTSVIFWGSSKPAYSISYVDSLFLVTSAMTEAGLNTVNLSQMTTFQQLLLAFLIVIGGQIWVSIWTVQVRKHAFERRFKEIVRRERQRQIHRRLSGQSFVSRFVTRRNSRSVVPLPPFQALQEQRVDGSADNDGVVDVSKPRIPSPPAVVSGANDSASPRSPTTTATEHITFADVAYSHDTSLDQKHAGGGGGATRRHGAPRAKTDVFTDEKNSSSDSQKLSKERRDELGGTEYRALKLLSVIVPAYFFCWQIFGCIALGAWIAINLPGPARANSINPWWNGIFNGLSAFNNSGMSVLDLNMIPYQGAYFVQIVMGSMILAGNTAYPILLRLGIWTGLKVLTWISPDDSHAEWKDTLRYILKYPRRVYTNMFGSRQTWWLLFMLVLLNGTDWVAYEVLNLGNAELEKIPVGSRVMNGLFQALAVRAGGFYIVPPPILYIGLQVLYVVMMYISAYPLVITMRHSNIYEERSLGIYPDSDNSNSSHHPLQRTNTSNSTSGRKSHGQKHQRKNSVSKAIRGTLFDWSGVGAAEAGPRTASRDAGAAPCSPTSLPTADNSNSHNNNNTNNSNNITNSSSSSNNNNNNNNNNGTTSSDFIRYQIRSQLSHDLWLIALAVLIITIIETKHFLSDPLTYSVFNILFEVVSAYGTVGISLGVPWDSFSFSGGWYTGSKLVLVLVMLRGRHRGLPVALDRAVQLPSDDMDDVEDQEDLRAQRTGGSSRGGEWRGQQQETAV